jgi:aryl-alcohol dehydrogenase-like predicted oxidoreductase
VTDDDTSRAAIKAGVAAGLRLFDTAQAYGAGHSERLLGEVLAAHPEVRIVTKVGPVIDEAGRKVTGATADPDAIEAGLEGSRRRLRRDRIDVVLLHLNSLPANEAAPVFDRLEALRARGWIGHYGWSTDFPDRAAAMAGRPGFAVVEHAMNVLFAAERLSPVLEQHGLLPLIRSPLAMGLLGGQYGPEHRFGADDVRSQTMGWMDWFKDGRLADGPAAMLARVRALLSTGGRTPAQGALSWLLARSDGAVPLPGFRTPEQVADLADALAKGPLDAGTMAEIETALARPPEGEPRER